LLARALRTMVAHYSKRNKCTANMRRSDGGNREMRRSDGVFEEIYRIPSISSAARLLVTPARQDQLRA
jgi:hypothetical protein